MDRSARSKTSATSPQIPACNARTLVHILGSFKATLCHKPFPGSGVNWICKCQDDISHSILADSPSSSRKKTKPKDKKKKKKTCTYMAGVCIFINRKSFHQLFALNYPSVHSSCGLRLKRRTADFSSVALSAAECRRFLSGVVIVYVRLIVPWRERA